MTQAGRGRRAAVALAATLALLLAATSAASAAPIKMSGNPVAVSMYPGHIDVFARGSDGALWHKAFVSAMGGWGKWESLGGQIRGNPSAVSWGDGHIDVFARGTDDRLYHRWWNGAWQGWERLGDWQLKGDPKAISWGRGHIAVFARGYDDSLIEMPYLADLCGWCGWRGHGGVLSADPDAISFGSGHLDVFVRGTDLKLHHKWHGGSGWSGWGQLGDWQFHGKPGAVSWGNGHIDVFARGLNDQLIHQPYLANLCGWCGWSSLGGTLTQSNPQAVTWGDGHIAAYVGGPNGAAYDKWFYGGGWGNWWRVSDEWQVSGDSIEPHTWGHGHLDIFWRHPDGTLRHRFYVNGGWSANPQESLGMPDRYPSSTRFGGSNGAVDTYDEKLRAMRALEAETDAEHNEMWADFSPADQTRISEFMAADDADGSNPTPLEGDASERADAPDVGADEYGYQTPVATAADETGGADYNDHWMGLCKSYQSFSTNKSFEGALLPRTTKMTLQWFDKKTVDGVEYIKIQMHVETLPVYRSKARWAGVGWTAEDPRPGTNRSYPFRTSTERDKSRAKKMPHYFHTSAWVKRGTILRFKAKARHWPVTIRVPGGEIKIHGGDYPAPPKIWNKCRVDE